MAPPRRAQLAPWLLLVLTISFVAYAAALRAGFVMDDLEVAIALQPDGRGNPNVGELHSIGHYFSRHYWDGKADASRLYRPITVLSFALRNALFGPSAFVAHLINVVLHLIGVGLVFAFLRRCRASVAAALVGAAFFGVHAIHAEAVIQVVGRAELLAFCFGLGALLCLPRAGAQSGVEARIRRDGGGLPDASEESSALRPEGPASATRVLDTTSPISSLLWRLGAVLLLWLALCSKESALGWVGVAFVVALAERRSWRRTAIDLATLAPAVLCWWFLRSRMLASLDADPLMTINHLVNPLHDAETGTRLLSAMWIWGYGLLLNVLPFGLVTDYGASVFPLIDGPSHPAFWTAMLAVLAICGLAVIGIAAMRRAPLLFVGLAVLLGLSFGTSNVPFVIGTIFGERLWYAPSLGVAIVAAWAGPKLWAWRPAPRSLALAVVAVWSAFGVAEVWQRADTHIDQSNVAIRDADRQPRSVRLALCAAYEYLKRGEHDRALAFAQRALELDQRCAYSWLAVGSIQLDAKMPERALETLERGLEVSRKRGLMTLEHRWLPMLVRTHGELGNRERALAWLEKSAETQLGALRSDEAIRDRLQAWVHDKALPRAQRERAAKIGRRIYVASPGR